MSAEVALVIGLFAQVRQHIPLQGQAGLYTARQTLGVQTLATAFDR